MDAAGYRTKVYFVVVFFFCGSFPYTPFPALSKKSSLRGEDCVLLYLEYSSIFSVTKVFKYGILNKYF